MATSPSSSSCCRPHLKEMKSVNPLLDEYISLRKGQAHAINTSAR
jgi:hypothetical protein